MGVEEELDDSEDENPADLKGTEKDESDTINYRQAIAGGSFMPVILLLHKKLIDINEVVDES